MPFAAALFDMDGLLLDTERIALECFEQTAQDLGLDDIARVGPELVGLRMDDVQPLVEKALAGRTEFAKVIDIWKARYAAALQNGVPLKPGARQLLHLLCDRGLPCAVATSTHTDHALEKLRTAGIDGFFQAVIGGDQVENGKPAPDIYHRAASSLEVLAVHCVAFEDSDPGIRAAIASGARSVQVPDMMPPGPNTGDLDRLLAPTLLAGAEMVGLIPGNTDA